MSRDQSWELGDIRGRGICSSPGSSELQWQHLGIFRVTTLGHFYIIYIGMARHIDRANAWKESGCTG